MRFLLLVCGIILTVLVQAQTIEWTGFAGNHLWSDDNNWSTGGVPKNTDRVLIKNDSVHLTSMNPTIEYLALSNAVLFNESALTMKNLDTFALEMIGSDIHNIGSIQVVNAGNHFEDEAILIENMSTVVNNGSIIIEHAEGRGVKCQSYSTIMNEGLIAVNSERTALEVSAHSELINIDSIILSNLFNGHMMFVFSNTVIVNDTTGLIIMEGLNNSAGLSIRTSTSFNNYGKLQFDCPYICLEVHSNTQFQHLYGTIHLTHSKDDNALQVTNSSSLFISPSASLSIHSTHALATPLFIELDSSLDCQGEITISN